MLLTILDQETKQPFEHEIRCWAYVGKLVPGWPELEDDGQHDFEKLQIVIPPDFPQIEPEPEDVCRPDLSLEACGSFGGKFNRTDNSCYCP